MPPSTSANPERRLNWLFLNPANPWGIVPYVTVSSHSPGLDQLNWIDILRQEFDFRAHKPSIQLLVVGYQPISSFSDL
jgi:hypothetical protein